MLLRGLCAQFAQISFSRQRTVPGVTERARKQARSINAVIARNLSREKTIANPTRKMRNVKKAFIRRLDWPTLRARMRTGTATITAKSIAKITARSIATNIATSTATCIRYLQRQPRLWPRHITGRRPTISHCNSRNRNTFNKLCHLWIYTDINTTDLDLGSGGTTRFF